MPFEVFCISGGSSREFKNEEAAVDSIGSAIEQVYEHVGDRGGKIIGQHVLTILLDGLGPIAAGAEKLFLVAEFEDK